MSVRVRFAPSPTGDPHVGGLRTALFNFLFARKEGGQFILRIEDTDRERYLEESVENIKESLKWLKLDFDEGPFFQSERTELYQKYAEKLVRDKKAYLCFCTKARLEKLRIDQAETKQAPRYDKHCLKLTDEEIEKNLKEKVPYVVRLNIPEEGSSEFTDLIRGKVTFENRHLDDCIIVKSDGFPTYHLANVVDDHEMKISHVIRAEEWLPSTPKHIILYKAFGLEAPTFAHLPLILGHDKKKLSKRHGSVSIMSYKKEGYLPEALINFLAFLGWNPKTNKEFFTLEELIQEFSLEKVNKAGAIFNLEKLNWLNACHIRKMKLEELMERGSQYLKTKYKEKAEKENIDLKKTWAMVQDRIVTLDQINELCDFVFEEKDYLAEILIPLKSNKEETIQNLKFAEEELKKLKEKDFEKERLKERFLTLIKENNLKTSKVLWPLRVSLSSKRASPDVFDILELFGKKKSIEKVEKALAKLNNL